MKLYTEESVTEGHPDKTEHTCTGRHGEEKLCSVARLARETQPKIQIV